MASRRTLRSGLGLVAAALLASGPTAGGAPALIEDTLEVVNRDRLTRASEPLVRSTALEAAARIKADVLAAEVRPLPEARPSQVTARARLDDLPERLRDAGFAARQARAHVVVAERPFAARDLLDQEAGLRRDLLDPELRELGLAVVREGRLEILVAIVARSKEVDFVERTAALDDLESTREELLRLTNEARRDDRSPLLRVDPCLEETAQRYAERMVAEKFYGHRSPEGENVGDRVRAAGCRKRAMGENLARGQTNARQVIDGWLDSPGHRRNLLNRDYRQVGFGFAKGRLEDEHWVFWVQVLADD